MNKQPTALYLAQVLQSADEPVSDAAAAELRRLHAENERLHQINQAHEMKLSVRGYEIQIEDLKAALELPEQEQQAEVQALMKMQSELQRERDYWEEEARRYAGNADFWKNKHEQPERTLTDEVIADLWHQNGGFHHHFARAVERWLRGEK